ncbi:hypothetical protein AB0E69_38845 [Kribbella sp. NPDC026611]|uniref:hypothetical protein n=1 Tax=Kribbella sp. NPDC026611 TaxID=3154911 RepID=UPI0033DAF3D1
MTRKLLVVVVGTAGLVLGLSSCAGHDDKPAQPAPAGQQVGSPEQELDQIGSTLDQIDGELASDGSP